MVNDLLKIASKFYKISQDPITTVKAAVDAALNQLLPNSTDSTVMVTASDVKIDVSAKDLTTAGKSRGEIETAIRAVVQKINPAIRVIVTASIKSEEKVARLRKNFSNFHKLAQCLQGDPLCDDLPPDPLDKKNQKPSPKPSPRPAPKPAPKDANQADDALPADIVAALDSSVQGVKGSLRLDVEGKNVTIRYNSDRIKVGPNKVKEVINSALSPLGYQIIGCTGETNVNPNYVNA
jgi:hypothetical protein